LAIISGLGAREALNGILIFYYSDLVCWITPESFSTAPSLSRLGDAARR
jgi:hypothetical protein